MAVNLSNGVKPLVSFVLGGPGAGKGTQCKKICDEFSFKHLSAGDLLRAERNTPKSQYGEMIERHIREGTIVPSEVTCSLLEKAMLEHCTALASSKVSNKDNGDNPSERDLRGKFLIDGFPRNKDNLQGWTEQLADKVEIAFVLFFDCPHEVCIQRCLARGQQGSNRSDDNEESIKKRLVTFTEDTMPIVEHYAKVNLLKKIDSNRDENEIYSEVRKLFQ